MAPTYKPLSSGIAGIPAEIFNPAPILTFQDAERIQQTLEAQELSNRSNELLLNERQRRADQEKAQREAIMQKFGTESGIDFNPDEALQIAQRIAIQNGDLDTALDVERTTRDRLQGNTPLTPEERALYGSALGREIPEGMTTRNLTTLAGLQKAKTYADQVDLYASDPNRKWNAVLKEQKATGTEIRTPSNAQIEKLGAGDAFVAQMDDLENRYLPHIAQNRGQRFLEAAINPNSAEARLQGELNLAAKQAALSLESRVTDKDYEIIADIATIQPLDTNETVLDRMYRLKEFIQRRNAADLNAMKAGGVNTSGLLNRGNFMIPKVGGAGNAGSPYVPQGSQLLGVDEASGLAIVRKK